MAAGVRLEVSLDAQRGRMGKCNYSGKLKLCTLYIYSMIYIVTIYFLLVRAGNGHASSLASQTFGLVTRD